MLNFQKGRIPGTPCTYSATHHLSVSDTLFLPHPQHLAFNTARLPMNRLGSFFLSFEPLTSKKSDVAR